MNRGQKLTKLDLSQAYQQLLLNEKSSDYLTINMQSGLFHPTRLQFGVHSAAGIFQREMKSGLSHIPFTIVRMDEILISGKNSFEHKQNLVAVLKVLKIVGWNLKKKKCEFMSDEVSYLGFIINKDGISPIPDKILDLLKANIPENVSKPKIFLGMLNYYYRHLSNLADTLEPLLKLLRKNIKWKWGEEQAKAFVMFPKVTFIL